MRDSKTDSEILEKPLRRKSSPAVYLTCCRAMESKDPGGGGGAGGGDRDICQPSGGGGGGGGQRGRGGGQVHEGKYTDQHNLNSTRVRPRDTMPTKCLAPPSLPSSPTPNPAALLPSTFHAFHRNAPPPLSLFARSVRRHEFGLRDAIPSPSTSHAVHDERSLHVLTWQRYGHDGGGEGECAAVEPETGTRCAKEVYMFVRTSMVVGRGCGSSLTAGR